VFLFQVSSQMIYLFSFTKTRKNRTAANRISLYRLFQNTITIKRTVNNMINKWIPEELKKAIRKALEAPKNTKIPDDCEHRRTQGDNYGVTCLDCGATLEGCGYWAEGSKTCIHKYVPSGDNEEICAYCEAVRPKKT
jgi:hypothetical protein